MKKLLLILTIAFSACQTTEIPKKIPITSSISVKNIEIKKKPDEPIKDPTRNPDYYFEDPTKPRHNSSFRWLNSKNKKTKFNGYSRKDVTVGREFAAGDYKRIAVVIDGCNPVLTSFAYDCRQNNNGITNIYIGSATITTCFETAWRCNFSEENFKKFFISYDMAFVNPNKLTVKSKFIKLLNKNEIKPFLSKNHNTIVMVENHNYIIDNYNFNYM